MIRYEAESVDFFGLVSFAKKYMTFRFCGVLVNCVSEAESTTTLPERGPECADPRSNV